MSATSNESPLRTVFITGGTGYIGAPLIHALIARGHRVRALVRPASRLRAMQLLPAGCDLVEGDALDASSFAAAVRGSDTFVQMVGVPHPSPRKAQAFRDIDLAAALAGLSAAKKGHAAHFVYLSVTQFTDGKAPAMQAYVASRAEAEARIAADAGAGHLCATFLRPWYVLGPGHRWPLLLKPLYWLASLVPSKRDNVAAMGLVTREEMVAALVDAIEHPPLDLRIIGVPQIREIATAQQSTQPAH
ncbi:MAG: NmrA family NAD(P)-binding protein [Betaproteobacteria bacterium]|nr:NmrA family NAD(P)-binding protein [Betaproteobacteria bacterium]